MSVGGFSCTTSSVVSRASDRGDPHAWNSLENYLHVHESHLNRLQSEGFIVEHNLDPVMLGKPPRLIINGRIRCQHGIFVDVMKELEVRRRAGKPFVRTELYSYHVGIEGDQERSVFRYDNAHAYPGHGDAHHKHCFNHDTWQAIEPPEWVGQAGWPHLSDAINEAWAWWDETGRYLDLGNDQ
jgi:hypothetical protein